MFFPEGQIRVHLYGVPADMRKSFDGLSALARNAMGFDPLSGHLFVFINRRATQIKVLYFDRSGFCVWAKRLEAGCFVGAIEVTAGGDRAWPPAQAFPLSGCHGGKCFISVKNGP